MSDTKTEGLDDAPAEFEAPQAGSDEVEIDLTPGLGNSPKDVDDGMHRVVVSDITEHASTQNAGQKYKRVEFVLKERPDDGTLSIAPSKTAKGKFPWATVLSALGVEFKAGEKNVISRAALIGKEADAFIQNEPGKKDPSKSYPQIKALSKVKGAKADEKKAEKGKGKK